MSKAMAPRVTNSQSLNVGTLHWTGLPNAGGHRLASGRTSRRQRELRPWRAIVFRHDRQIGTLPFGPYKGLSNTRWAS
jgi:hypothetical protein